MNTADPIDKEPLNVLWVDDDANITELFKLWVEAIGHKCSAVNSGTAALEHLENNLCDIVFTDIGMPEMNGWELAEAIRNKFGSEMKIVAVSGWDMEEKIKDQPTIDFALKKPFALADLKKLLLKI